jgi:hypothetical protein
MGKNRLAARHQGRPQRRAARKANATGLILKPGSEPVVEGRRRRVDSYDVREWFVADPSACVSDAAAQRILRDYEYPYKWWITLPVQEKEDQIRSSFDKAVHIAVDRGTARGQVAARASIEKKVRESAEKAIRKEVLAFAQLAGEALVADQVTPWWQSLRNHLAANLPEEIVTRFADYFSG